MLNSQLQKRCYICNEADHLAKYCKTSKSESKGSVSLDQTKPSGAKKVVGDPSKVRQNDNEFALMDLLLSDSDDKIKANRVKDEGSSSKCVPVLVQGVQHTELWTQQQTLQLLRENSFVRWWLVWHD